MNFNPKKIIKLSAIFFIVGFVFFANVDSAQAAITLRGTGKIGSVINGGNVTLTFDTGANAPQTGDVVVVFGGSGSDGAGTVKGISTAGYALIDGTDGADVQVKAWYKIMGATPDTTVVGLGGGDTGDGVVYGAYVIDGATVDVTVLDQTTTKVGQVTGVPNAPSIATQTAGAMVIALAGGHLIDASVGTVSGYSNALELASATETDPMTLAAATKIVASPSTEDPAAWSAWTSANYVAITIALKPAPAAGSCSSTGSTPWSTGSTWTGTCRGVSGQPWINDTVTILNGHNVTIPTGLLALAGNVTVNSGGTLTITSSGNLNISGNFTNSGGGTVTGTGPLKLFGSGTTIDGSGTMTGLTGATTLSNNKTISATAALSFGGAMNVTTGSAITITAGADITVAGTTTVTSTGSVTNNGTFTATGTFTGTGTWTQGSNSTLNLGGATTNANAITTFTATASGNTVKYNGAAQTIKATTYVNLTANGSGAKTFTTASTVNGIYSIQNGTNANVYTAAITYGSAATLQYNAGSSARSVLVGEWPATFLGTGGVIIKGTGAITLDNPKVLGTNTNVPLDIDPGATLTPGANLITLHGDFINDGTLTSGSGGITIAGTTATQSIAGFTTTGTVTLSKTSGTATATGNFNGNAFTVNGVGGTLDLGTGLTHTFTGAITLTNGTLSNTSSNISTISFSSSNSNTRVLTMGSGTWELTSTGTVWDTTTVTGLTINANTSTIKLTNNSGSLKTFSGGGNTYNNIWFAPSGGAGTFEVRGANTFADFRDNGTAAHSILFTAGTTTIVTSWTVTGNTGQLITINSGNGSGATSTSVHTLSDTTGTNVGNYLNIQHSVAGGGASWYAGANSTNNQGVADAGSGWIFTSPPCNSLATGNWNTAGTWLCAHVPTTNDVVTISAGHTVTMDVNSAVVGAITIDGILNTSDGTNRYLSGASINISSTGTLTGNGSVITLNGTSGTLFTKHASGTFTHIGYVYVTSDAAVTLTSGAITFYNLYMSPTITADRVYTFGPGAISATNTFKIENNASSTNKTLTVSLSSGGLTTGAFDSQMYGTGLALLDATSGNLTAGTMNIATGTTFNAEGSTLTVTGFSGTLITNTGTFNADSSTTILSGNGNATISSAAITFNNLTSSGTSTKTLGGATNINGNLSISAGTLQISTLELVVTGTTSITGTIDDNSSSGYSTFFGGVTINNGGTWTSTGNSGYAFRGGLTVNSTSSFTSGTGLYTFESNAQTIGGTQAFTITSIWNYIDTGSGLTFSGANPTVTNLIQTANSVLTFSGTVPTITNILDATASGNTVHYTGSTQTVKATTYHHLTINSSGTATLGGTTIANGTLTLTAGTLDAGNNNITADNFSSSNSTTRAITMGSGIWELTGTGTVWNVATSTGLTVTANTSTIKLTNTSATGKTFAGGTKIYGNIWFAPSTSIADYTISGDNTFADFKDDGTGAHSIIFSINSTTTISSLTLDTDSAALISLEGVAFDATWYLVDTSGTNTVSYVSLTDSCASGGATWDASNGTNFDGGNNCGWSFSIPTTRYWVGGGGDAFWTTTANWSYSSGGAGGATVPDSTNDVFFNASGNTASTLSAGISIKTLDMTGYANTLTHNAATTLTVVGDTYKLASGMTYTLGNASTSATTFTSTTGTSSVPTQINTNGKTLGIATFNGSGGYFQLNDSLTANTITQTAGTLLANATVTVSSASTSSDLTLGVVTKNSGSDSTLTIKSGKSIVVGGAISSTSNKLNLILNADSGANTSGYINVGAAITTNGGTLTMGGGSGTISAGSGYAAGNSGQVVGVYINNVNVNAGGGNIIVNGQGDNTATGNSNHGVQVTGASGILQTSGSGTITISGLGKGITNSASNNGVKVDTGGIISTVDGLLTISNTTGGGAGSGTLNAGVFIIGTNSTIKTTGTGSISITATGGNASGTGGGNYGVYCNVANCIQTTGGTPGTITINGTGGAATGSGSSNYGVYVLSTGSGGSITGASGSNISITGTGGASTNTSNYGIMVSSSAEISTLGSGTITLNGTGGGRTNSGTNIGVTSSGIVSTVNGLLTITANGGGAGSGTGNYGLTATGIKTTGSGNISITATGGNGSGSGGTNYGIYCPSADCIQTVGTGHMTISGTGGGSSGTNNYGVYVFGSITGASGSNISLTGIGGSGAGNSSVGVYILGAFAMGTVSTTGSGTLTVVGTGGGSTNSSNSYGVQIYDGTLSSTNGLLTVTGTGGGAGAGTSNYGVYVASDSYAGSIKTTDSGNIIVNGIRGGGNTANNYGVNIATVNGLQTTSSGTITVNTDTILLAEAGDINSVGALTIAPYTASGTVGVAGGTGTLGLTSTFLGYMVSTSLQIGNSSQTGTTTLGVYASWAQPVSFVTHSSGSIAVSGAQTNSSSFSFTGPTTLTADITSSALTIVSGTFNAGAQTVTLTGTGTPLVVTGTFTAGTGLVTYTGDGSVTVPAVTYYNLKLSPTITSNRTYTLNATTVGNTFTIDPTASSSYELSVNMGANLVVTGTTTIQKTSSATSKLNAASDRNLDTAYLNIASGGTYLAQDSTITLTGTSGVLFTKHTSGTFTPGGSTVILSGNGAAMISSGLPTFNNLTLTGTGVKSLESTTTLNGSLNIGASSTLSSNGSSMIIAGSVTNSGTFDLASLDDATLFLTATGITDHTISLAITNLVLAAKAHGWWEKMKAIYPLVGGTATTNKYNLKDPRDLDAAFRLGFTNKTGDPVYSATGVQFGGVSFARTYLTPSTALAQNDTHISYYSRTNTGGAADTAIGVNSAGHQVFTSSMSMFLKYTNGNFISDHYSFPTSRVSTANSDSTGYYMASRIASDNFRNYKNGGSLGAVNSGSAGTIPSKEIYLGALNDGDVDSSWPTSREAAFATIGYGIDSTLAATMYADVQAFQTALGRNIGTAAYFSPAGPTISVGDNWTNTGTIVAGTSTIKLTSSSSSSKTFAGGGATYYDVWIAPGAGDGDFTISGNNTFNDLKDDGSIDHSVLFTSGSTQTLNSWNINGTSGNLITISSTDTGAHYLVKTGSGVISADYLNIQHSVASPLGRWLAGENSINNQNVTTIGSGWIFKTPRSYYSGGSGAGGESQNGGGGNTEGGGSGGGASTTATGLVVLSGGAVQSVTVTSGGSGYTSAPIVSFCAAVGSGAAGTSILTGDAVSSVTIESGGSSYNASVTVLFGSVCPSGGGGGGGGGDTG